MRSERAIKIRLKQEKNRQVLRHDPYTLEAIKVLEWCLNLAPAEQVRRLKHKPVPDQELIEFANDFSLNFEKHHKSIGKLKLKGYEGPDWIDILSSKSKYTIRLFKDRILSELTNLPISTDCRIGHTTGRMEFSFSRMKEHGMNSDYIFYVVLWLWFKNNIFQKDPDLMCDQHTLRYIRRKFPKVHPLRVFKGVTQSLSLELNERNIHRLETFSKSLTRKKKK